MTPPNQTQESGYTLVAPLVIGHGEEHYSANIIYDANGDAVCEVYGIPINSTLGYVEADIRFHKGLDKAKRIVSCVNALSGLNPEAVVEVVGALERCDPGPDYIIDDDMHDGNVFCELSVGDVRAIRRALYNLKNAGGVGK